MMMMMALGVEERKSVGRCFFARESGHFTFVPASWNMYPWAWLWNRTGRACMLQRAI